MFPTLFKALRLGPPGTGFCREFSVGRHRILAPRNHQIDTIRQRWNRYDVALGEISRAVFSKYPKATAIDIGANIGDSAALINKHHDIPVLCVEGNQEFLPILRENIARLGPHVELEESFVADDDTHVDTSRIESRDGTASVTRALDAVSSASTVTTKSLTSIVQHHPQFARPRLLKIDTDGFDFLIISNALDFLDDVRPVVFFEYYLEGSKDAQQQGLAAVEGLFSTGYRKHLVYDNFGNLLISVDTPQKFVELNAYLKSNKKHGTAVYYFDVCSFHQHDADLFDRIRREEVEASAA